jgi:hypothetical protein
MPLARRLLASALVGLAGTVTGWLVIGHLFHRFQAGPPATGRPAEVYLQHSLASAVTLISAILALMAGAAAAYAIS